MMSSVIPSLKNSCSGSLLMLANGRTATDGLSGRGRACRLVAACVGRRAIRLPEIDEIDMDRLRDVLDAPLALVEELQLELVADLLAHGRRAGDAARPCQGLSSRAAMLTPSP